MIHKLKIEIEPWMYPNNNNYELKVQIYFDGQEYEYREIMPFDVMQSFFDQIWQHSGNQIKEKILESRNGSTKV